MDEAAAERSIKDIFRSGMILAQSGSATQRNS
jgi:hypothetical protein